ncbi:PLD nuclease N-terminal domain-containing protein [Williamsia sp. 1135]|uniref:PLD nuclease N-terminal domain-containing protein n=1 Tax=Williamsia sp. 1135 TaxID=1889262 RepID=UPI001F0ACFBD|nr:PLD nuclease N-terminal domain-containing protein [Williamsia sp. 1135]
MLLDLALIGSPVLSYTSVAIALMLLALVIGLIDVLCRDDTGVRLMPRWAWFLVVVAVPIVGTLVWLVFGRPRARRVRRRGRGGRRGMPQVSAAVVSAFPEYDRPGRFIPQDPAADAEFLRQVRERAQEQRRVAELERRRREGTNGSAT